MGACISDIGRRVRHSWRAGVAEGWLLAAVTLYLLALNSSVHASWAGLLSSLWVAAVWAQVAWLPAWLHRWVFKAGLIVHVVAASVAVFAKSSYGTVITEDLMLSAITGEHDLTAEMVSARLLCWLVVTALLPALLIAAVPLRRLRARSRLWQMGLACTTAVLLALAFFGLRGYQFKSAGHIRDARFLEDVQRFSPVDVEYNLHRAWRAVRRMQRTYAQVQVLSQTYRWQSTQDDLLVVFVIGESTRGDHFALNGYQRPTNPRLSQVQGLYSWRATACDTLTVRSVHCLASPMLRSQSDRTIRHSSLGEVMHHLGYRTEIYALQTMSEFYRWLHYDQLVTKYAIVHDQPTGARDISLLPYARRAIAAYQGGRQLLVLHTLGSHQTYADRFTPEQAVFMPWCSNPDVARCAPQELVNAYDNSVIAVDHLLGEVIHALHDKKALLVYVSDHGESLGEGGHYFHGMPIDKAPPQQFDVPLLIWLSDAYRHSPQGAVFAQRLQQAHDRAHRQVQSAPQTEQPFDQAPEPTPGQTLGQTPGHAAHTGRVQPISHDHIFHTVLGCAGITSDNGGIDPALNLCAPHPQ